VRGQPWGQVLGVFIVLLVIARLLWELGRLVAGLGVA